MKTDRLIGILSVLLQKDKITADAGEYRLSRCDDFIHLRGTKITEVYYEKRTRHSTLRPRLLPLLGKRALRRLSLG